MFESDVTKRSKSVKLRLRHPDFLLPLEFTLKCLILHFTLYISAAALVVIFPAKCPRLHSCWCCFRRRSLVFMSAVGEVPSLGQLHVHRRCWLNKSCIPENPTAHAYRHCLFWILFSDSAWPPSSWWAWAKRPPAAMLSVWGSTPSQFWASPAAR